MIFTNPKPQHQYEQVVRIEQEHFYNNVNIRTLELEYCAGGSLRQWLESNHIKGRVKGTSVPTPIVFVTASAWTRSRRMTLIFFDNT